MFETLWDFKTYSVIYMILSWAIPEQQEMIGYDLTVMC